MASQPIDQPRADHRTQNPWIVVPPPPEWRPCDDFRAARTFAVHTKGTNVETAKRRTDAATQTENFQSYPNQASKSSTNNDSSFVSSSAVSEYEFERISNLSSESLPNTSAAEGSHSQDTQTNFLGQLVGRLAKESIADAMKTLVRRSRRVHVVYAQSGDSSDSSRATSIGQKRKIRRQRRNTGGRRKKAPANV